MYDVYSRMELLLGQTGVDRLGRAQIAVFGLGGVGSYAVEALARCGVGSLTLVDHDVVSDNKRINRHAFACILPLAGKRYRLPRNGSGILMRIFWSIRTKPFTIRIRRGCLT